ncbi:AraC family transcriptional regulator [Cohnella fermenti]|uniref:Helix-turn-helix domain-containing protein n=1 Tax=Cohnella fermenti TaxID=2565925 RepID=A0A4S4BUI4_9BACL|nr:AraC family transcriptional regulator [Cohnella fermenti]THF78767.1 helix-turn-helix domain-containing protein [Cohnella fermenti]
MSSEAVDAVTNSMLERAPVICSFRTETLRQPGLHSHNGYEVYLCAKGKGRFFAGDRMYPLAEGALFIIPPMRLHLSRPESEPFHRFVLSIEEHYWEKLLQTDAPLADAYRSLPDDDRLLCLTPAPNNAAMLQELLLQLEHELARHEPYAEAAVKGLLLRGLAEIARLRTGGPAPARSVSAADVKVEQILRYFSEHYQEELPMDEVAAKFRLSRSYMYRIFKNQTGFAPNEYVAALRLNKAKAILLRTDWPIIAVAAEVGFRDLSHFCHMFKRFTHTTPSGYRSRFGKT